MPSSAAVAVMVLPARTRATARRRNSAGKGRGMVGASRGDAPIFTPTGLTKPWGRSRRQVNPGQSRQLETAVAEYVDWFNHRRLHGESGLVPPAGFENTYYRHDTVPALAEVALPSLY
ncbi:IS3 family transposase [Kocuria rhizosphaericola]|uniref:IS3 family transposase n=1 Tax=Kocuria rhizosphaericola TaxID=3376284 RepID=UPI0037A68582